jgi:hypothetical protein
VFPKPAHARFTFRVCLDSYALANRVEGNHAMILRTTALVSYLSDRLPNHHPRFHLFLLNLFFSDRDAVG